MSATQISPTGRAEAARAQLEAARADGRRGLPVKAPESTQRVRVGTDPTANPFLRAPDRSDAPLEPAPVSETATSASQPATLSSIDIPAERTPERQRVEVEVGEAPQEPTADASPIARWGWRGLLNRLPGVSLRAASLEAAWWRDRSELRRQLWPRTVQIGVIGLEGGAGRTTVALALALAIGDARRGDVVAWDGTRRGGSLSRLGEAGGQGLTALTESEDVGTVAAMSALVARQPSACDVLGWAESPSSPMDVATADRVRRVLARYYTAAIADTDASDPWSPLWEDLVRSSDAVVMVHSPTRKGADEATQTLAHLRRVAPEMARRCLPVAIGGAPPAPKDAEPLQWQTIPRDPAFTSSGPMRWDDLRRDTQCALTHAGRSLADLIDKEHTS